MGKYISADITTGTYVRARLVVEYAANASANNNGCKAYVQMWRTNTGYQTSGSGTLYIKTEDDADWWTSSISNSQVIDYNSYTQVGKTRTFTINCDKTGRRTIKIKVKATSSIANIAFAEQEFSITLDPCPVYDLSVTAGTGSAVTVNRTTNASGGSTGNITAGSKKLYYGDKLKITFTPSANYSITTHTVNDAAFTSNGTHTVNGNVTIRAAATPLKSLVAATDANIGSTSSIIITRYNNTYTHTLTYNFKGLTGTIATKTADTAIPWTVPDAFYAKIPSDPDGICIITCTTYNGSNSLGSTECEMTVTAAEKLCAPSLSIDAYDANDNTFALTGDRKKIIRFHSDVKAEATATENNGAYLKSIIYYCGYNFLISLNDPFNEPVTFYDADAATVSVEVKDSRGYTTTEKVEGLSLIEYIKLTTRAEAKRTSPTSDTVIVTAKGNYYNGNFGAVNNTLRLQVQYKPKSKSEYETTDTWTEMTVTLNGNTYTAEATVAGLDYKQAYDIRVRAEDKIYKYEGPLAEAVQYDISLNKGIPVFDWGENDFSFNVPISIQNQPVNDIVIELGKSDIWIYRKWASGIAECWGVTDAITQTTSTDWNIMTSNTETPAVAYPFAFKNPPVVSPSVHIHDMNFWLVTYSAGSTTHTPTYQIARGKSESTVTFKLGYYVFGQWK